MFSLIDFIFQVFYFLQLHLWFSLNSFSDLFFLLIIVGLAKLFEFLKLGNNLDLTELKLDAYSFFPNVIGFLV